MDEYTDQVTERAMTKLRKLQALEFLRERRPLSVVEITVRPGYRIVYRLRMPRVSPEDTLPEERYEMIRDGGLMVPHSMSLDQMLRIMECLSNEQPLALAF